MTDATSPDVPRQAHGVISLDAAACTSCLICVRECPTWCISLESHPEHEVVGRRTRTVSVLDDFRIDFGLCMNCGICIEVCPTDALSWQPDFDYPAQAPDQLVHHTERLESWRPA